MNHQGNLDNMKGRNNQQDLNIGLLLDHCSSSLLKKLLFQNDIINLYFLKYIKIIFITFKFK